VLLAARVRQDVHAHVDADVDQLALGAARR
jgi:hypothetical protein